MGKSQIELQLEDLNLRYDQHDIKKLNVDINYLQEKNLSRISERLLSLNKPHKFIETLTEFKFTVQLLKSFPSNAKLSVEYEPNNTKRPIDLVIKYNEINYFIQIKSLSNSIRENKQSKIVREIRKHSKDIHRKRGVIVRISEAFSKEDVSKMMDFIKENLNKNDKEILIFNDNNNVHAEIEFLTPTKSFRNHLSLYSFGDLEAANITGMTKNQVKSALEKAAGAFENNNSDNIINLIVSEIRSDRLQAIDFAEAIYGTENFIIKNGRVITIRLNDGLFLQDDFAKKIAGIIILHKKDDRLTSDYERAICCNPSYDYLRSITDLIHDKVIERFTWIDSGFFES
jgi:hypothetical protein